ncbi:CDP-glycerol glycerophosphotransferase family protein [uncultured Bacteroides sp.]|uniref:CDP-glycerol glycerophosphotransferase family protein n=1 Tax=uncultured Bacteroides sp. TaxID=162156 RepID=UPI002AA8DD64|nr:CDP-glycerol glycerophosphotransferase family protein [uncultured Bacteroides sp.]
MDKHYLFFVSLTYSYSILRPLQEEIWRRGDNVAWFIEPPCENWLTEREKQLETIQEVFDYNPIAVFSPGNWVFDFFPGIKVEVFHGYAMRKRVERIDDHFTIRGWYDIYCTQGKSSTPYFKELEKKHGFFKVYETGWCKVDAFFNGSSYTIGENDHPTILYSPTFSKGISSASYLFGTIKQLAENKSWNWIITFHPKLDDAELIQKYKELSETRSNVVFNRSNDGLNTFRKADVMLCDSSSIIVEFMLLEKPVVTFRNTHPGNYLLNVLDENDIEAAIEKAISRPKELMDNIHAYTMCHEAHRDGHNSVRVLDAVDDFILNYKGKIKNKPLNLIRRIKIRFKARYYRW